MYFIIFYPFLETCSFPMNSCLHTFPITYFILPYNDFNRKMLYVKNHKTKFLKDNKAYRYRCQHKALHRLHESDSHY